MVRAQGVTRELHCRLLGVAAVDPLGYPLDVGARSFETNRFVYPVLSRRAGGAPTLDLVIPVYNEERDLGPSVQRVNDYLTATFPYSFRITIADNASTDSTWRLTAMSGC